MTAATMGETYEAPRIIAAAAVQMKTNSHTPTSAGRKGPNNRWVRLPRDPLDSLSTIPLITFVES